MEKNEINKAIARKLFGKELWLCKMTPNNTDKFIKADFCGDIADAWKVVEKITEPPQTMVGARQAANAKFMWWWQSSGKDLWCLSAEEAAEAICRAALKAIGE